MQKKVKAKGSKSSKNLRVKSLSAKAASGVRGGGSVVKPVKTISLAHDDESPKETVTF